MEEERQPTDKKKTYNHVMKAKLYGVMAINTIEGISWEIDNLLPSEYEKDNVDVLSDAYRKYHNGKIYPTSYADQLDRAVKSLGKDLAIAITVDLVSTQAVKKELTKYIRACAETDRNSLIDWLNKTNDYIMKSERFEDLVNHCCLHFYKKTAQETSDDNLSFIRRSANELLRNKASKEAMKKRIVSNDYHFDEDDVDTQQIYTNALGESSIMIVDQNVIGQHVQLPYDGLQMNPMIINGIPLHSYDGLAQMQHMNQPQGNANVSMSIPVNVNMNGINQIIGAGGLSAMSVAPMGGLQIPVNMQTMNLGVLDGQRSYGPNVNAAMEIPLSRNVPDESEDRNGV